MRVLELQGGYWADNLPTGEYASLVQRAKVMRTHLSDLPLPQQDTDWPRFHRITMVGGFQIAGQAQNSFGTWHWKGGVWTLDPRIAHGESGCIFDNAGVLRIIEPAPHQTTQGYRNVSADGRLVLGDETILVHGLSQYTNLGDDLLIGQGHDGGGCRVWIDGQLRELESGDCRFIRASRIGSMVAVAMAKPDRSVLYWLSVAELREFPLVDTSAEPQEPPMSVPDWTSFFEYLDVRWPPSEQTPDALHRIVGEWNYKHGHGGFGLLYKSGGQRHNDRSEDWILERLSDGRVFGMDVIVGMGGTTPTVNRGTPMPEPHPDKWRAPPVPNGPKPPPLPPPDSDKLSPPTGDLSSVLKRIAALEAENRKPIALKSAHGRYVSIESDGRVIADRERKGSWEWLTVERE